MVIIDTTVWIDYFAGRENPETSWLDRELDRQRLGLTDLIVLHQVARFEIFPTGGKDLAVAAARNYRTLRSRGITVRKTIDCLIATFCREGDHRLLHRARDFDPFEQHLGLRVVREFRT